MYRQTYNKYKARMKDVQEDYPTTETWWKRKVHEDYPTSVTYIISKMKCVMQQMQITLCVLFFSTMFP